MLDPASECIDTRHELSVGEAEPRSLDRDGVGIVGRSAIDQIVDLCVVDVRDSLFDRFPHVAHARRALLFGDVRDESRGAGDDGNAAHDAGGYTDLAEQRADRAGRVDGEMFAIVRVDGDGERAQRADVLTGYAFRLSNGEELRRAWVIGLVHMVSEARQGFAGRAVLGGDLPRGLLPVRCGEDAFDQRGAAFHGVDEYAADSK